MLTIGHGRAIENDVLSVLGNEIWLVLVKMFAPQVST